MSNKNNGINFKNVVLAQDQSPNALHQLTRLAEQALKAQQNNQNTKTNAKETKK